MVNLHHVLSFFNVASCEWCALSTVLLQSTDSVVENNIVLALRARHYFAVHKTCTSHFFYSRLKLGLRGFRWNFVKASSVNLRPLKNSFSLGNKWKSLGAKSGENGGWLSSLNPEFLMAASVRDDVSMCVIVMKRHPRRSLSSSFSLSLQWEWELFGYTGWEN